MLLTLNFIILINSFIQIKSDFQNFYEEINQKISEDPTIIDKIGNSSLQENNKYEEYNHITNIKTRNYLDIKIPIESNFHYYVIRLFSFLVIVIFILVSIMVNLGIFYIQSLYLYLTELNNQSLTNAVNKNWPYISSIIIYIFREILSYIFCKVLRISTKF